jgi:hypothetical protein
MWQLRGRYLRPRPVIIIPWPLCAAVWEESIVLLPHSVRFVFLSATIPNSKEFAQVRGGDSVAWRCVGAVEAAVRRRAWSDDIR